MTRPALQFPPRRMVPLCIVCFIQVVKEYYNEATRSPQPKDSSQAQSSDTTATTTTPKDDCLVLSRKYVTPPGMTPDPQLDWAEYWDEVEWALYREINLPCKARDCGKGSHPYVCGGCMRGKYTEATIDFVSRQEFDVEAMRDDFVWIGNQPFLVDFCDAVMVVPV